MNPKVRENKICPVCGKEFYPLYKTHSYCSQECSIKGKHVKSYKDFLDGNPNIQRANYSPRKFYDDFIEEQEHKCAICGIKDTWNGKRLRFIIDHIDGHASHNYRDNIRCICPNCDSQLDTYKSKNKNSDRIYRYQNK